MQLLRTLSSSFRINTANISSSEPNDEQSSQPQIQLQSSTWSQHRMNPSGEVSPPLVYVLCVPISNELETEWRGITHIVTTNKHITSILPLNTNWKTTTIFLLTQQTNNLEKFEESFKERLSKTNVQQNDLYNFDTRAEKILQKRSCFNKVDHSMNDLSHAMLSLSSCVASNVQQFEKTIKTINIQTSPGNNGQRFEKVYARTLVVSVSEKYTNIIDSQIVFLWRDY